MTTTPRIFRNCALSLPLVVLGAGVYGGSLVAAEVAVAGAVGVMNFALISWLGSRMVELTASGDGGGIYGVLFAAKSTLIFPAFLGLMVLVGPVTAVVGFCVVVLATLLTGIELAFVPEPTPAQGPSSLEIR